MHSRAHHKTLLEIILMSFVVCFAAALMIPNYSGTNLEKRAQLAEKQILAICKAMREYNITFGCCPSVGQGLFVLKQSCPDLSFRDPWNSEYNYRCPGHYNPDSYDIISPGPDRQLFTHDDIINLDAL